MKKITTENHVKTLVKDWFDARGAWSYAPIQNGMGVHGIPDRVGCVPLLITQEMVGKRIGMFVAVECKRPGRRTEQNRGMSKHQQLVVDAIYDAHGRAVVCDGLDDMDRLLSPIWLRTGT